MFLHEVNATPVRQPGVCADRAELIDTDTVGETVLKGLLVPTSVTMKAVTKLGTVLGMPSARTTLAVGLLHLSPLVDPGLLTRVTDKLVLVADQVAYKQGRTTTILHARSLVRILARRLRTVPLRSAG